MFYVQALPFLFGVLVVFLIDLLAWDILRYCKHKISCTSIRSSRDDILIGFLVLAAFTSGVFVAIILLTIVQ